MKLAIYGYGNLGKAAESGVKYFPDIELTGIYTRRNPETLHSLGTPVYRAEDIYQHRDEIDVLFIAGGSATDLPLLSPKLARDFNIIDSFDNHTHIPEHFSKVHQAALESGHTAIISAGWDPGLFSLARLYTESVLPEGKTYTFWGKGVSQGHSDAVRRIEGVLDARQYTVPMESALNAVRCGSLPDLNAKTMHLRECFVVAKEGADLKRIENEIIHMPDYFEGYQTKVHFISLEELKKNHSGLPHGGFVIRSGNTGVEKETRHTLEFNLNLESNPEFTSSVILSLARALYRLHEEGVCGCKTVLDIPPKYLSLKTDEELLAHIL